MPALDDEMEERLAHELAKGQAQGTAYVSAGYSAKNNNVASVNCNRLLKKKPAISERATELKQIARTSAFENTFKGDVETLAKMYLEDRKLARELGQPSAAISAISGLVKLYGLGGENVKVSGAVTLNISKEARDAIIDAALQADA